jgi:pimeloyl-ACP methyl ester carboxylesterase
MPKVEANGISMYYEQQGTGEPLILIPYLSADNACYAFQVADYAKYFTCITLDLRGSGKTDSPQGDVSIEQYADDVAALMQALHIPTAHVSGLSLGAAIGMWLAAKHPHKVKSLSLHSGWAKSDEYLKTIVEGWQAAAKGLNSVTEMVIRCIFPWCFTPELYTTNPDLLAKLGSFLRSRPTMSVAGFMKQSNAVIAHDVEAQLNRIKAPTQITFGREDRVTSLRFAERLQNDISDSELVVFENCSHAPIYENVQEFNERTLEFLKRHSQAMTAFM